MASKAAGEKYGFQLILAFNPDATITEHLKGIQSTGGVTGLGGRTTTVIFPAGLTKGQAVSRANMVANGLDFRRSLKESKGRGGRVYVMGHGNWQMCTIGGYTSDVVAATIKALPADAPVALVSVLGCSLGRDTDAGEQRVSISCDSFAAKLHKELKGVCNSLYARGFLVKVMNDGVKRTSLDSDNDFKLPIQHRAASKLHFSWRGAMQVREYVTYKDSPKEFGDRDAHLKEVEFNREFV